MYLRPWHDISINTSLYRKYKEYSLVKKVKRGIIPSMETLRGKGVTDATMETYGFWADMLLTELAGKENASAIEDLKDPGDSIELIPTVPAVGKITVENVGYKGNLQKTFFDLRGKCILRLENPEYYARTYLHYKISISLVPQK